MIIVDAHCDTITKIMESKENIFKNNCHLDIQRMKKYDGYLQFFAAFIDPSFYHGNAMKRAVQIIDTFYKEIEAYPGEITLCRNYKEIEKAFKNSKIAAFLSIEGGEALQGELSALRIFYRLGVRSICLTWNHRNEIADGVAEGITGGGLTSFGRTVVHEMNSLGMLIDVSHISEKGFWDVLELSDAPIIASHSNAQVLCSHRRNLSDKQIQAIKSNGGVIGVNLYPSFLNNTGTASLKDVMNHIEYMVALIGEDHIGLGADFDGIETTPSDILGVQDLELLFNELAKLNYSEEFIGKFAGGNFLNVIKKVCP